MVGPVGLGSLVDIVAGRSAVGQRLSRKASSWSLGRNLPGLVCGGSERASARSLSFRSACRYGREERIEPPRGCRTLLMVSLPGREETVSCSVVRGLDLGGCEVVDRFVGALVVEPVDPVHGLELDVVDIAPGPFGLDQFGLVGTDLGLGEGVVVGVADRTDRGVHACFEQAGGERERGVLGGFNWSSQHLDFGGVQGWRRRTGVGRLEMRRRGFAGSGVLIGR